MVAAAKPGTPAVQVGYCMWDRLSHQHGIGMCNVRTVVNILQSKLCRHYSSAKMRTLEQFRERSVIS